MSDLGSLSQCLVDSDADACVRARRLRSKALVLSVVLEGLLLAAMLVWPLISPGVLSARYNVMPTPPYSGGGPAHHGRTTPPRPPAFRPPTICRAVCAPLLHPETRSSFAETPDLDTSADTNGSGPGPFMLGTFIPGGSAEAIVAPEPPRPEPPALKPRPMSEGVMAAKLVQRIEPAYPAIARAAHVSGIVHLHAIVGKDGSVRELEAVDGNILLAQAAKAAVQRWRYQPTLLNGEPVEVDTYITVHFVLN
jgi:protein TonB